MTCVVAIGNSGNQGINAPADAFYVIAVGSVTSSGAVCSNGKYMLISL